MHREDVVALEIISHWKTQKQNKVRKKNKAANIFLDGWLGATHTCVGIVVAWCAKR